MSNRPYSIIVLLTLFFVLRPFLSFAGEPTDSIKACTDRLLVVVSDAALKSSEMKEQREQMILETVDKVFSWEEFAKRSLAKNWIKRTPEEKKEFIALFRQLIVDTYMGKTYQYSGESITYLDEQIEGDHGNVTSVFNTSDGKQISVEYRIMQKDGSWWVYDLKIEGVSLVSNYRTQFKEIILGSSYGDLVVRLKEKLEK
jgi:phospholipid transport system substrate-binding protein